MTEPKNNTITCAMKSYRLSELSKTEVNSLKARPRIDFSSTFSTLIQLLKRHLMLPMPYMYPVYVNSEIPYLCCMVTLDFRLPDGLIFCSFCTSLHMQDSCPGKYGSICKAGVTHSLKAGVAQAISAMACGTSSCPRNSEVMVSIDIPAGPSEVLVIADKHPTRQVVLVIGGDGVDMEATKKESARSEIMQVGSLVLETLLCNQVYGS
ncbi:hypothetical protein C5167_031178 [Papaver somniferum]|nr:hypothetical protein C5167_031178 [Papaver somniferum]